MKPGRVFVLMLALGAILGLPVAAYTQEVLNGIVKDTTGGVLPGVSITATLEASGNTFVGVTDGLGLYRIPVRPGVFRITAEMSGFTTIARTGIEVLVGQQRTVNLDMALSSVQETVTVSGEAPLLNITQSSVGGNIDPRQMQELPVQGRDWMALAMVAPGNRTNDIGGVPVASSREDNPEFELNMDGQQMSNNLGVGGQPRFSRDAIAEFQFISNRFDATQGRSASVQVNAVSKSGTNSLAGSFGGYFRNSDWNAEDHVLGTKVPLKNQQYSGTIGGPLVKDRLHFFANFEYQRSPRTTTAATPYPAFNVSMSGIDTTKLAGGRLDYQLSPDTRLMVKGDSAKAWQPFAAFNNYHPAGAASSDESSYDVLVSLTQVLSSRALNELRVGYAKWGYFQDCLAKWDHHPDAANGTSSCPPRINMVGFRVWPNTHTPRLFQQKVPSIRDDFTFSYTAKGRHDLKVGGEFLYADQLNTNHTNAAGTIDARGGPVPANIAEIFPDPFNVDTWNLNLLGPITRTVEIGIGSFYVPVRMPKIAIWSQDDWKISEKVTLNLGLRYDLIKNAFGQQWGFEPWLSPDRPEDTNNIQPRLGFAWSLNDRTVVRGGGGLYYADVYSSNGSWAERPGIQASIIQSNDGRKDFVTNPFNGPLPTFANIQNRFCYVNNVPGCLLRTLEELPGPDNQIAQKLQVSIGAQRQLGPTASFEADYVYNRGRNEKALVPNVNLTYNPQTGVNYPWTDRSHRFDPNWGIVGVATQMGTSAYHGVQTAFHKRFSHNWQAGLTYTLSGYWTGDPPAWSGLAPVPFSTPDDLGSAYSLGPNDQRHRAVLNGIWQVRHGFQVSGMYFYGSGARQNNQYAVDLRGTGSGSELIGYRLYPNGSIVPRNNLVGQPIHRVDTRFQQRIPGMGNVKIDAMLEVFNLFDRANFGDYVTDEASPQFGSPLYSANLAYAPRTLQLGFRMTF